MELKTLIGEVETAIRQMGLSAEEAQADENGQWILLKEEMPVYMDA